MALQVWLPLNGNLKNKGLAKIKMASTNAVTYVDGKIGQAIKFADSTATSIYNSSICEDLKYTDNFSYCFWLKSVSKGSAAASYLFTVGRADAGSYGYGIAINSATQIVFRFGTHSAAKDIVDGKWNFIAFTKSGTTLTYYINGVVSTATFSGTLPSYISSEYGGLGIGCFHYSGNIYPCNATISDFRIYDHCLSLKEIKDISKGLVLHYPLDSLYDIGSINKIDGTYSEGQFSSSSFQKTKLTNERGWHYTYNYTGTTSNTWPNASSPAFSYTIGKTYYHSLKVRCNTWTAGSLSLRASRSDNDYATNSIQICDPSKADGQWHEYYTYIKITGDTYNRSGTQVACSPRLEVYCSNLNSNGTVYTFDFDIKDIQVVESDTYLPYVDNSLTSNIVYDSSGYSRNGTNMGTLTVASDSPRYSKS